MDINHLSYPPGPGSATNTHDHGSQNILIFQVPGNPGLIGYYAPFLSKLRELLDNDTSLQGINFHIYGQSFAGFIDRDHEPFTSKQKPYDLEYQIQHILKTVSSLRIESGPHQGQPYDRVLLTGHSVGAYIILEICHRVFRDPSLAPGLRLASGIFLFPTVDHIADSPSGWKLNMLRQTPLLGDNAYRIAQGFLRLWPYDAVHWFVSRTLGFPPHAADVTARWLKSRDGVWQSLYLGMDEMRVITEDKWDDELWEISQDAKSQHSAAPKFYFFFGRQDHWVADRYRDEFIRKRSARDQGTARLVVDEGDLPHAFCIDHSEPVAEKVHAWIIEMFAAA